MRIVRVPCGIHLCPAKWELKSQSDQIFLILVGQGRFIRLDFELVLSDVPTSCMHVITNRAFCFSLVIIFACVGVIGVYSGRSDSANQSDIGEGIGKGVD